MRSELPWLSEASFPPESWTSAAVRPSSKITTIHARVERREGRERRGTITIFIITIITHFQTQHAAPTDIRSVNTPKNWPCHTVWAYECRLNKAPYKLEAYALRQAQHAEPKQTKRGPSQARKTWKIFEPKKHNTAKLRYQAFVYYNVFFRHIIVSRNHQYSQSFLEQRKIK